MTASGSIKATMLALACFAIIMLVLFVHAVVISYHCGDYVFILIFAAIFSLSIWAISVVAKYHLKWILHQEDILQERQNYDSNQSD